MAGRRARLVWRILWYGGAAGTAWLFALWPLPSWYQDHFPRETAFMAMRRGEAADSTPERRYDPVPLAQMATILPEAVRVSEDQRFYQHGGLDFQAIREAIGYRRDTFVLAEDDHRQELRRAVFSVWSNRHEIRGASTITQQLAKNLYLSPSRNPLRKVKEAVTAWRLEAALEKPRIMELYLNVVEFGPGVWGVEAASQRYFDRPAARLTRPQAALLAATLPSPLSANPGYRVGRIRWRQDLIMSRLGRGATIAPRPVAPPMEVALPPPVEPDSG
jgi:monofunctional biosynthetic peptidoglycan transglycosylase